jgi:hypothetical protein
MRADPVFTTGGNATKDQALLPASSLRPLAGTGGDAARA